MKKWNLGNPTREISKLEHQDGVSKIEVEMVPGVFVTIILAFVVYMIGFWGISNFIPIFPSFLIEEFGLHPIIAILLTVIVFFLMGIMAFVFLMLGYQYLRGTETLEINGSTVKYKDKSRSSLNQSAALKSFRNLSVRDNLGSKFLENRYGLVADLAGTRLEFGVGLTEDDAEKILAFITTNHPDVF